LGSLRAALSGLHRWGLHVTPVGEYLTKSPLPLGKQGLGDKAGKFDLFDLPYPVQYVDGSPIAEKNPLGVHSHVVHVLPLS
jgi:hypothetical protein